jgi:Tol biopolymer transport system component
MTDRKKIGVATLLGAAIVLFAYLLGYLLPAHSPPPGPGNGRIAFSAGSSPLLSGLFLNYDIYVMNFGASRLTRITRQAGIDAMPAWSPQGDKIAYYGAEGLYVVNADGSGQPELLRRGSTLDPAWSPDGSKIAFSEGIIYMLDVKTGQVTGMCQAE